MTNESRHEFKKHQCDINNHSIAQLVRHKALNGQKAHILSLELGQYCRERVAPWRRLNEKGSMEEISNGQTAHDPNLGHKLCAKSNVMNQKLEGGRERMCSIAFHEGASLRETWGTSYLP